MPNGEPYHGWFPAKGLRSYGPAGLAIGLLIAFAVARLVGEFLIGVGPTDPLTYLAVSLILSLIALAACYVLARRAMQIEPITALRYE